MEDATRGWQARRRGDNSLQAQTMHRRLRLRRRMKMMMKREREIRFILYE